jgi:hypothetical protein
MVSHAYPCQIDIVREVCSSHVGDNGAFTAWKQGKSIKDWNPYYKWIEDLAKYPSFSWAVIPDVIDGSEAENDALLEEWPHGQLIGVPVWHLHESIERLRRMVNSWPRVALGSSGEYQHPGTDSWWQRMATAMDAVCVDGFPQKPLHLLRGLSLAIFQRLPLASADSVQVGVNVGLDTNFLGRYAPKDKAKRAAAIADYIEQYQAATRWDGIPMQDGLFGRTT